MHGLAASARRHGSLGGSALGVSRAALHRAVGLLRERIERGAPAGVFDSAHMARPLRLSAADRFGVDPALRAQRAVRARRDTGCDGCHDKPCRLCRGQLRRNHDARRERRTAVADRAPPAVGPARSATGRLQAALLCTFRSDSRCASTSPPRRRCQPPARPSAMAPARARAGGRCRCRDRHRQPHQPTKNGSSLADGSGRDRQQ